MSKSARIEKIVRPFETGNVFDSRVAAPVQPATDEPENMVLVIEGNAEGKYQEEPSPVFLGYEGKWDEDPSRRVTDTVRITNPDDTSQFVDVERIKKMVIVNDKTREEIPIKMNWS